MRLGDCCRRRRQERGKSSWLLRGWSGTAGEREGSVARCLEAGAWRQECIGVLGVQWTVVRYRARYIDVMSADDIQENLKHTDGEGEATGRRKTSS